MYVKLFASILESSVWAESPPTRLIWISMLAMADYQGHVRSSVSGLARRANVSATEARTALKILSEPDDDSTSPEYEGRRIEKVEGGWNLLNYAKYREIRTEEQLKAAARQRKHYHKHRQTSRTSRTDTDTELDTEEVQLHTAPTAPSVSVVVVGRNGKEPKRYEDVVARITQVFGEVAASGKRAMKADETLEMQADMVFAYWAGKLGHESAMLDTKRVNRLKARLAENRGNVHELLFVVDGARKDDHLMGRNGTRQKYDGIETLYRDRGQVERLAELGGYKAGAVHPMAAKYANIVALP